MVKSFRPVTLVVLPLRAGSHLFQPSGIISLHSVLSFEYVHCRVLPLVPCNSTAQHGARSVIMFDCMQGNTCCYEMAKSSVMECRLVLVQHDADSRYHRTRFPESFPRVRTGPCTPCPAQLTPHQEEVKLILVRVIYIGSVPIR